MEKTETEIERELQIIPSRILQAKLISSVEEKKFEKIKKYLSKIFDLEEFEKGTQQECFIKDHYYDTDSFHIKNNNSCVRIRDINGCLYLQVKTPREPQRIGEGHWSESSKKISSNEISALEESNFAIIINKHFKEIEFEEIEKN